MQVGVFQTTLAGVLDAGEGKREPAILYLYLKGMKHAEVSFMTRWCPANIIWYHSQDRTTQMCEGELYCWRLTRDSGCVLQVTTFRGFMFLESADHEWYNWGGTGLCMPQVAIDWLPRVFFR